MKRMFNLKVAIAVLVVSGVVGFLATVPSADAFLGDCTYRKDATHKRVVGRRGTGCCGENLDWGIVTAYKTCENLYGLDVVCPNTEF